MVEGSDIYSLWICSSCSFVLSDDEWQMVSKVGSNVKDLCWFCQEFSKPWRVCYEALKSNIIEKWNDGIAMWFKKLVMDFKFVFSVIKGM